MPEKHAAAAAAAAVPEQEQEALFAAKHEELVSEARDVARELGVTVRTVAFRPDGTAVADDFVGGQVQLQQRVQAIMGKKVSAMGQQEVTAHRRQLQMLRSVVVRELELLQAKRAPGQLQETDGKNKQGGGTQSPVQQDHQ